MFGIFSAAVAWRGARHGHAMTHGRAGRAPLSFRPGHAPEPLTAAGIGGVFEVRPYGRMAAGRMPAPRDCAPWLRAT